MLKKTSFFLAIHDIRDVSVLVTSARSLRFVAFYPERILQLQLIYFKVHVFFFQVFAIAAHLVYWGMATIVYPLCESNVYVVAPNSSVNV